MKRVILLAAILCVLTGCENNEGVEYPKIKKLSDTHNGYYYSVDEKTGVIYLEYDEVYAHSITVMFNKDGTVMTKDDILKEQNGE